MKDAKKEYTPFQKFLKPFIKLYVEAKIEFEQEEKARKTSHSSCTQILTVLSLIPLVFAIVEGEGIIVAVVEFCADSFLGKAANSTLNFIKEVNKT